MVTSEVDICNLALGNIGVTTLITSLDDASKEAQQCKLWFTHSRDKLLEADRWPFATRRATLALTALEHDAWDFVYALPGDCLAVQYIWSGTRKPRSNQRIPHAIEYDDTGTRSVLLTDLDEAKLVYTVRLGETHVPLFPDSFIEAFAWKLASNLAMPLTAKLDLKVLAEREALRLTHEALAATWRQQQEDAEPESEFISTRIG